jgi:hypothetical protein
MPELVNEFSWSKSRHEKFEDCPRAYYYHYYGSWGGWEAQPGSLARELYVLKKLSSRWQWAGSVVHHSLRQMLSRARFTGSYRPLPDLLRQTRERARAKFLASREKSYWREASRIEGLVEHEYGEPVPDSEWKRIYEEVVEGSLRAFYGSEAFARIREVQAGRWLTVDELDCWTFEGVKVWVAIDFAYRDGEGRLHLLDWKTGREREVDHTQVGVYALYAREKWGVQEDAVLGGLVYLGNRAGELVEVRADPAALEGCRQQMRRSIGAMRAALDDPGRNLARIERFRQLEDREACRRCPFRRPCGRL